ncbi:UvrABC system protein B [compost metagenome]
MNETERRRRIQQEYNEAHGITPQSIKKRIKEGLGEVFDGYVGALPLTGSDGRGGAIYNKFSHAPDKLGQEIEKLRVKMKKLSADLEFEEAAKVRDEIKRLQIVELNIRSGTVESDSDTAVKDGLK